MGIWLHLVWAIASFGGPVADFCGESELVASLQILRAERELQKNQEFLDAHVRGTLDKVGESDNVLSQAISRPFPEYLKSVSAYLTALEAPVDVPALEKKFLTQMAAIIRLQQGTAEGRQRLLDKLERSAIVPLQRVLEDLENQSSTQKKQTQQLLAGACGNDAMGRGGIAFQWGGERVFAFCPGALLHATVEDGKRWAKEPNPDALWFTAFHELGHVLGADRSSPLRAQYAPLVQCMERETARIGQRYEDEAIADFWGAVGLGNQIAQSTMTEEEKVAFVARNLAPFRQGSLFSPHHLPFGARLQIVRLELCRVLEERVLSPRDCRIELE